MSNKKIKNKKNRKKKLKLKQKRRMRVNIHKNCELLNFLPFSGFVQNITVYIPKLFKQNKKQI